MVPLVHESDHASFCLLSAWCQNAKTIVDQINCHLGMTINLSLHQKELEIKVCGGTKMLSMRAIP